MRLGFAAHLRSRGHDLVFFAFPDAEPVFRPIDIAKGRAIPFDFEVAVKRAPRNLYSREIAADDTR